MKEQDQSDGKEEALVDSVHLWRVLMDDSVKLCGFENCFYSYFSFLL